MLNVTLSLDEVLNMLTVANQRRRRRRRLSRISPLSLFRFRIYFSKLMNLFGQLVGLLGRGISPTQGLYLHRTTQHRETRTHFHASSWIRISEPSVRAAIGTGSCRW
jgi:hypothetical protein